MQNNSTISYLKIFHGLVKFGKGAAIFLLIVTIISSFMNPNQIDIPIQYKIENAGILQLDGATASEVWLFEGEGRLKYHSTDNTGFSSMSAFNIFFRLCILLASFIIYYMFDKIIQSTIDKKPFSKENADSVKWLAYIFIITGILSVIYKMSGVLFLDKHLSSEVINQDNLGVQLGGYFVELLFNRGTLLGLFALLFSQIIRYGVELKEESELTI